MKNKKREETSAHSYVRYVRFVERLLLQAGGVMTKDAIYDAIWEHFGPTFGPDDERLMGTGQLKWRNQVASALVHGQGGRNRETLFLTHNENVVLVHPLTPPDVLREANVAHKKQMRKAKRKKCNNCRTKNPLTAKACRKCRRPFPPPTRKIDRE